MRMQKILIIYVSLFVDVISNSLRQYDETLFAINWARSVGTYILSPMMEMVRSI